MADNDQSLLQQGMAGAASGLLGPLGWWLQTMQASANAHSREAWLDAVGDVKLTDTLTIAGWMQADPATRNDVYNQLAVYAVVAPEFLGPDDLKVLGFGWGQDPDADIQSVTDYNTMLEQYLANGGSQQGASVMISASDGVVEDIATENLIGDVATVGLTAGVGEAANLFRYGLKSAGEHAARKAAANALSEGADLIAKPTARAVFAGGRLASKLLGPVAKAATSSTGRKIAGGVAVAGLTAVGLSYLDGFLHPQENIEADLYAQGVRQSVDAATGNTTPTSTGSQLPNVTNPVEQMPAGLSTTPPQPAEDVPKEYWIGVPQGWLRRFSETSPMYGGTVEHATPPRYWSDRYSSPDDPTTGRQDEISALVNLGPEGIAAFQEQMVRAGLLDENEYFVGVADPATQKAMLTVMGQANIDGTPWYSAAAKLAKLGEQNRLAAQAAALQARRFVAPVYEAPDPAALRQSVKSAFQKLLGRDPFDWEIPLLADSLKQDFERQYGAQVAAARAEFDAQNQALIDQIDGGNSDLTDQQTIQSGTVQQVEPFARLLEKIDTDYAQQKENLQQASAYQQSFAGMRAVLGGIETKVKGG